MDENWVGTTEQKQQYLRKQILEQNYDAQDFLNFMCPNSQQLDLEEWDLIELEGIVAKYKLLKQIQKDKSHKPPINRGVKQQSKSIKTIKYQRYDPLEDDQTQQSYSCILIRPIVKVYELNISVPSVQIKQTQGFIFGIGSTREVYYVIQTNLGRAGQIKTVKRLDEDLLWLSQTLIRLYPHLLLPELEIDPKRLPQPQQSRRKQIQQYLKHLSYRQELLICQVLIEFLTLPSQKLDNCKKNYNDMRLSKDISLMKTKDGLIKVSLTNKERDFSKQALAYLHKKKKLNEKVQQSINKLIEDYERIEEDLDGIVGNYAELYNVYTQLTEQFPQQKNQKYTQMLINLNNLFDGMSNHIKKYIETMNHQIRDYYQLQSNYTRNAERLNRQVRQAQKDYLEFKYALTRKKQRIYYQPERWQTTNEENRESVKNLISKMNEVNDNLRNNSKDKVLQEQLCSLKIQINSILLGKQSEIEMNMKLWYGFLLGQHEQQFRIWIDICVRRYCDKFKELAKMLLQNDKIYLECLTNFISQTIRL